MGDVATQGITGAVGPQAVPPSEPLLAVEGLQVSFPRPDGVTVSAVWDVSYEIAPGESLGIVGESGSGKSMTAMALLDLIPRPGQRVAGSIKWNGVELTRQDLKERRGRDISIIFQDPVASLDPLVTVGRQIVEVLQLRSDISKREARLRAIELLDLVGIPLPAKRVDQFPFEYSGGMAQRASIAIALAAKPSLLIADEPTSSLDVTIQAQILDLIADLQVELNFAMMLISHDLAVVASSCDRVLVMYAGQVMEEGPVRAVLESPVHPYTAGLVRSTPRIERPLEALSGIPGMPPELTDSIPGCSFAPRCGRATDVCTTNHPVMLQQSRSRVACFHPLDGEGV